MNKVGLVEIEQKFDLNWYKKNYQKHIELFGNNNESVFDFYIRIGNRLGHDPNEYFSEIFYLIKNSDIHQEAKKNKSFFGFYHYIYINNGNKESRNLGNIRVIQRYRELYYLLDLEYLRKQMSQVDDDCISPYHFYFEYSGERFISPSKDFSEEAYGRNYPDVFEGVMNKQFVSCYEHYIYSMHQEKRLAISPKEFLEIKEADELQRRKNILEENFPSITYTKEIELFHNFSLANNKQIFIDVPPINPRPGFIILVPDFLPEILFGGYLAFYDFLKRLKFLGDLDLYLIVTQPRDKNILHRNTARMRIEKPAIYELFENITYLNKNEPLQISLNFNILSYCAQSHYLASMIAEKTNKLPFFFIQEYEPDFAEAGSHRTWILNAFRKKHYGIYNSEKLHEFFTKESDLDCYSNRGYEYTIFENEIKPLSLKKDEFLKINAHKEKKRMIIYGRPEAHAARNELATILLALEFLTEANPSLLKSWDIVAVGSLCEKNKLTIKNQLEVEFIQKLPYDEYLNMLISGDVGISLISTPHPGIVHFQMAALGLIVITNTTKYRTREWLEACNKNLRGVDLEHTTIANAIKAAISESENLDKRYENAMNSSSVNLQYSLDNAVKFVLSKI